MSSDRSPVGMVVNDIKTLVRSFSSYLFKQVSRRLNVIAHLLARSWERLVCNFSIGVIPNLSRAELCNNVK
jgi:hypothetical protein